MFKLEDIYGNCNAHLYIGDDYADNHATMVCDLEEGHDGLHQEQYKSSSGGLVTVTWENDDRRERKENE